MRMTETTSQISPGKSAPVTPVLSYRTKRMYRRRGLSNLLKMGHCAPAVMQTLLDLGNRKEEWLVRMTAGLPRVIYAGHDYDQRFRKHLMP